MYAIGASKPEEICEGVAEGVKMAVVRVVNRSANGPFQQFLA